MAVPTKYSLQAEITVIPKSEPRDELCGFYIDVGEPEQLSVGRMVVKITYEDGDNDIMLIRSSMNRHTIDTRGHVCASKVALRVPVPEVREKKLYKLYNTHIMTIVRSYIHGEPADRMWHLISTEDKQLVLDDLARNVLMISIVRSEYFGHAQLEKLRTANAYTYVYALAMIARVKGQLDVHQASSLSSEGGPDIAVPVLCHGSLSPEHIILDGPKVVGIVGWSSADFKPPALDRSLYHFKSNPNDPMCWYRFISEIPCAGLSTSSDLMMRCINFAYWLSRYNRSEEDTRRVDALMKSILENRDEAAESDDPSRTTQAESQSTVTDSTMVETAFWNDSQASDVRVGPHLGAGAKALAKH
ncbi:hypothetical protein BJ878DRAFT_578973 [Calycina marina]|uniref:Aminoglycoside phosphotransferase domain-containing protein n=1 Tax=Calycina marina TaxID=1763456 RepID=A0A9P7YVI8_9HELO|nr:hypothetical protein BJ878DRAFT_578973 [Calycina marina]